MYEYELSQLLSVTDDKIHSEVLYSHKIRRVMLPDCSSLWVCKEIADPNLAKIELLAQEFFRLIIPHQPETRIARDPVLNTFYILSEEVEGYRPLPYNESSNFVNGTYTGLGQAMLISMFLEEIDLKNGNIGINTNNQVIKIDGDRCFAHKRIKYANVDFRVTASNIGSLPYSLGYYAFNWLDLVQEGIRRLDSQIVCPGLSNSSRFRAEVNQAIFKICCLPDHYLECFVDAYIGAGGQEFIDTFKSRRQMFLESALKNESFQIYLQTAARKDDLLSIMEQMKTFSVKNQGGLYPEEHHVRLDNDVKQLQDHFNKVSIKLSSKIHLSKKEISPASPKPQQSLLSKVFSFFGSTKPKVPHVPTELAKPAGLEKLKMARKIELRNRSSESVVCPEVKVPTIEDDAYKKENNSSDRLGDDMSAGLK